MFKRITRDLDDILLRYDKEQEAGCKPGESMVFFETMTYMRNQRYITLLLFYCYTFVKSKGKQYRQCYLPLKLCFKLYASCYLRIYYNRLMSRIGI